MKKDRLTSLYYPSKDHTQPLKRSMSGFELEMFVLDSDGKIDNSDALLNAAKKINLSVEQEVAKSMIEVICLPSKKVISSAHDLIKNLAKLSHLAQKKEVHLYPFGTFLGNNDPQFRNQEWCKIKEAILTPEKWINAGKCTGYHQHYALPRGMFNHQTSTLNYKLDSKIKRSLLDSYNILNAIDPIITCLLQSSPYTDCTYLAKDSRLLLYRGGKKLNYKDALYSRRQLFGALSPYKQTLEDLNSTIRKRHAKWKTLMNQHHFHNFAGKDNILDFSWNPVKINKKGTLEYRGGDMNFTKYILASGTMISFLLRKIQQDFLYVVPMDIDISDSFKVEGNMLFIPPHTLVRNTLQKNSVYEGLANKDLYTYCKRFLGFIQKIVPSEYRKIINPIKLILSDRRTVADKIMTRIKNKGYSGTTIPSEIANELAIFYSDKFKSDIEKTNNILENFTFPI